MLILRDDAKQLPIYTVDDRCSGDDKLTFFWWIDRSQDTNRVSPTMAVTVIFGYWIVRLLVTVD